MASHVVAKVLEELAGYQQIRAELEKGFDLDPQTLLDTLEGEANLHEALLVVAEEVEEIEGMAAGLKSSIDKLRARESRNQKTVETLRNIILSAMDKAGLDTVKGPCATLTRRRTPPTAVIDDEADVPAKFFKPQDPKLDKKAVKEALYNNEAVPGAHLTNGGISLTIRVK